MGYVNFRSFFTQSLYHIFAAEVRCNIDDVFIMHKYIDEHTEFLRHLFEKLRQFKLWLHPKKMNIAPDTANFLGYPQLQ